MGLGLLTLKSNKLCKVYSSKAPMFSQEAIDNFNLDTSNQVYSFNPDADHSKANYRHGRPHQVVGAASPIRLDGEPRCYFV